MVSNKKGAIRGTTTLYLMQISQSAGVNTHVCLVRRTVLPTQSISLEKPKRPAKRPLKVNTKCGKFEATHSHEANNLYINQFQSMKKRVELSMLVCVYHSTKVYSAEMVKMKARERREMEKENHHQNYREPGCDWPAAASAHGIHSPADHKIRSRYSVCSRLSARVAIMGPREEFGISIGSFSIAVAVAVSSSDPYSLILVAE